MNILIFEIVFDLSLDFVQRFLMRTSVDLSIIRFLIQNVMSTRIIQKLFTYDIKLSFDTITLFFKSIEGHYG